MVSNYVPLDVIYKYHNHRQGEEYNNYLESMADYIFDSSKKKEFIGAKAVTFQVTEACNLKCSYCYQICKSAQKLKIEDAKKFIELLLTDDKSKNDYLNQDNTNAIIIDFIGGEPFLEVDLIDQILDYFFKRCIELNHPWMYNFMVSVGTNGTLYFTEKVQKFLKKYEGRVSLAITVDGNKTLHDSCRVFHDGKGSYDIASKAAVDWMKRTGSGSTKLTIAPENVSYLSDAVKNMINLGFTNVNENCVYEDVWKLEHAQELYRQLKDLADYMIENDLEDKISIRLFEPISYHPMEKDDNQNWCGGNGQMVSVDVRGDIFNCVRYMKSSVGDDVEPLRIGNVNTGIGCCEKDHCNICALHSITRRSQSTDKCFNCPIAAGCGWCSAYNYQHTGSVNKRVTAICDTHTAEALANNYYWNKVLTKHNEKERVKLYVPEEWAVKIIGQEEYDMIRSLSGSDKIIEEEWYSQFK